MKVVPTRVLEATQALKSSEAVKQVSGKLGKEAPGAARQFFGFLFVVGTVVLILLAWNWAQNRESVNDRLWGELAFFGLVIGFGIAVASPWVSRLSHWLFDRFERIGPWLAIEPIPAYQALVWGGLTVVAFPIAMLHWPAGFLLLVLFTILLHAGLSQLASMRDFPRLALCWSVVASLFLLIGLTWASGGRPLTERTLAATEPAVPDADRLAREFRPLLFLDRSEKLQPLDLDDAQILGCTTDLSGDETCGDPLSPTDPLDEYAYIKVNGADIPADRKPGGPESAYYYHAVQRDSNIHIDYWWYFEHNPSPFGRGLLCGQAMRWLGKACAEHPADWEGITVVLAPCETTQQTECTFRIQEVHYAQHDKVVAYEWNVLNAEWAKPVYEEWTRDADGRPLVFTALDSHASYAVRCAVSCKQIAHEQFTERRDGSLHWRNNLDADCGSECLRPFPTDTEGDPSRWNAFSGPWGAQFCVLFGSYCDVQPAPAAPAYQSRFKDPVCDPERCVRRFAFVGTGPGSGI